MIKINLEWNPTPKVIEKYYLRCSTVCQERNESPIILQYIRVVILFFPPCRGLCWFTFVQCLLTCTEIWIPIWKLWPTITNNTRVIIFDKLIEPTKCITPATVSHIERKMEITWDSLIDDDVFSICRYCKISGIDIIFKNLINLNPENTK